MSEAPSSVDVNSLIRTLSGPSDADDDESSSGTSSTIVLSSYSNKAIRFIAMYLDSILPQITADLM